MSRIYLYRCPSAQRRRASLYLRTARDCTQLHTVARDCLQLHAIAHGCTQLHTVARCDWDITRVSIRSAARAACGSDVRGSTDEWPGFPSAVQGPRPFY
nr:MAG TPA: hypothetical protein [Bacteriophage sp.]DAG59952.1 MAG TPA: hypothetical protein [Caudoviricetes sp.]